MGLENLFRRCPKDWGDVQAWLRKSIFIRFWKTFHRGFGVAESAVVKEFEKIFTAIIQKGKVPSGNSKRGKMLNLTKCRYGSDWIESQEYAMHCGMERLLGADDALAGYISIWTSRFPTLCVVGKRILKKREEFSDRRAPFTAWDFWFPGMTREFSAVENDTANSVTAQHEASMSLRVASTVKNLVLGPNTKVVYQGFTGRQVNSLKRP